MKQCKSCKKEIDDQATKCPYCQGYQQWFKNPQSFGFIFLIPLFGFMIWQMNSFKSKAFDDFKTNFTVKEVRIVQSDDDKYDVITYVVKNDTNYRWTSIKYEVNGYDESDNVVLTNATSEYAWIVQPHSESYLSTKVARNKNVKKWKMRIVDMETSRF
jgi:regulation of enolase protein 1 (concanavalin A-like superfamily)